MVNQTSLFDPYFKISCNAQEPSTSCNAQDFINSIDQVIHALAIGILSLNQKLPSGSSLSLATAALGLHVWSRLPTIFAQTTAFNPTSSPSPMLGSFQINTNTSIVPRSIHPDDDGGFTVTLSDTKYYKLKFDSSGFQIGDPLPLNFSSYILNQTFFNYFGVLDDQTFVVAYIKLYNGPKNVSGTNNSFAFFGQRLDATGASIGNEFQISAYSQDGYIYFTGASSPDGIFAFTWSTFDYITYAYKHIYGALFDQTTKPIGNQFLANAISEVAENPSVTFFNRSNIAFSWQSYAGESYADGNAWWINGQLFNPLGSKIRNEFFINNNETFGAPPNVFPLPNGGFIVLWPAGVLTDIRRICGQLFDSLGNKVGPIFQISAKQVNAGFPQAIGTQEGFTCFWIYYNNINNNFTYDLYGQNFNPLGVKMGIEFRINPTPNLIDVPLYNIEGLTGGGLVVMWQFYLVNYSKVMPLQRISQQSQIAGRILFPNTSTTGPTTNLPITTFSSLSTQHQNSGFTLSETPLSLSLTSSMNSSSMSNPTLIQTQSTTHTFTHLNSNVTSPVLSSAMSQVPLIAGIAAATLALLCSLIAGIAFCWRRKSTNVAIEHHRLARLHSSDSNSDEVFKKMSSSQSPQQYEQMRVGQDERDITSIGGLNPTKSHYSDPKVHIQELERNPPLAHYVSVQEINVPQQSKNAYETLQIREDNQTASLEQNAQQSEKKTNYIELDQIYVRKSRKRVSKKMK